MLKKIVGFGSDFQSKYTSDFHIPDIIISLLKSNYLDSSKQFRSLFQPRISCKSHVILSLLVLNPYHYQLNYYSN